MCNSDGGHGLRNVCVGIIRLPQYVVNNCWPTLTVRAINFATINRSLFIVNGISLHLVLTPDDLREQ